MSVGTTDSARRARVAFIIERPGAGLIVQDEFGEVGFSRRHRRALLRQQQSREESCLRRIRLLVHSVLTHRNHHPRMADGLMGRARGIPVLALLREAVPLDPDQPLLRLGDVRLLCDRQDAAEACQAIHDADDRDDGLHLLILRVGGFRAWRWESDGPKHLEWCGPWIRAGDDTTRRTDRYLVRFHQGPHQRLIGCLDSCNSSKEQTEYSRRYLQ